MNRLKAILPGLFLLAILFASCSKKKKNAALSLIPKNASAVLVVQPQQLMTKLENEGITLNSIMGAVFGGSMPETGQPAKKEPFWTEAKKSGIDFSKPIYVSLNIPSNITDNNAVLRVILSLTDEKAFAETLGEDDYETKKENGLTLKVGDETAFGFNKKTAMMVGHINADAITGQKVSGMFLTDTSFSIAEFDGDTAAKIINESFKLDTKNSLADNEWFEEMPLENNDAKLWLNYTTGIAPMLKGDLSTFALLMTPVLKNSCVSAVMNFENGQIKGRNKWYFEKEAAEAIQKSGTRNIDLSAINAFPGNELNGYIGLAFDPATIENIVQFAKINGFYGAAEAELGLGSGELAKCFTGDASVVFCDAPAEQLAGLTPLGMLNKASWAAVMKLNDAGLLNKLLANPKIGGKLKKEGELFVRENEGSNLYFGIKNNLLYAGANAQLLNQFMAGTAKNNFASGPLAGFAQKPLGIYVSAGDSKAAGAEAPRNIAGIISRTLSNMILTGGRFEKNYLQSEVAVNMATKDGNSLAALFKSAFNFMRMRMMEEMAREMENDDGEPAEMATPDARRPGR